MTLLVSELTFATRAMGEAVEQGGSPPVCLSMCVQRAALNPHRMTSRLCLEESLEVRQDSPEGAARHPGSYSPVSRGRG